jgi:hypothetical protein
MIRSITFGSPSASGSCAATPRVRDHHVEGSECVHGRSHGRAHLLAIPDVAEVPWRAAAGGGDRLQSLLFETYQRDLGPSVVKPPSERGADPAGGSRYEDALASK